MLLALWLMPWQASLTRLHYFLVVDRYPQAAIFLGLTAVCVAAFMVTPFLRSALLRVPLVLLAAWGLAAELVAFGLSGQYLDETTIATLWREQAMVATAASGYFRQALQATGWLLPLIVIFAWRPAAPFALRAYWALLPVAALLGITVIAQLTASGTRGFVAAYRVPAVTFATAFAGSYSGPRDEITQTSKPQPHYSKIVMIVDESIRGDFLGINNPATRTTPFLGGVTDRLANFGPATAAHNCSAPSRLILRTGLQAADLPDKEQRALKAPTIWQFARQAGFETILIDAFAEVFGTHSFMTKQELKFIDRSIPVTSNPAYLRDRRIATELLPELLSGKQRSFIYVNKYGSHFPYQRTHPPDFPGDGLATRDNLDNRDELIASYQRALRWSVDEFFRALLASVDLSDTLIVYTSDHGQSLLEGGYKLTHCSTGTVHPGEGIVPLLTFASDNGFGQALKTAARNHFGRATHFQIFPTLLLAMGYEAPWIARHYGEQSLLRLTKTQPRFLTGNMFGSGFGAKWIDAR